jgi:hypothetical protein
MQNDDNQLIQPLMDRRVPQNNQQPCADHAQRLALTEKSVTGVERTMTDVSAKLDLILVQITKVAILEEKHSNLIVDNDRAHKKISELSTKFETLALETRAFINYAKGQNKVLWLLGGVVGGLLIKALFFAANHGMTP